MAPNRPFYDLPNLMALALFLMFLGTGVAKLAGAEFVVATFGETPLPTWTLMLLGLVEVAAAALVIVQTTRRAGIAVIATIMIGATLYHLTRAEWLLLPIPVSALVAALVLRALDAGATDAGDVSPVTVRRSS